jgi:hypothetical protein
MSLLSSVLALFPSFVPGNRLVDGGDLASLASELFGTSIGLVALAGGGQTGATPLPAAINRVDTCASNSDSVMLPQAIPGRQITVYNNTANTLAVFGIPSNPVTGAGDTIAARNSNTQQATGTGITIATTLASIFFCYEAGEWKEFLSN